MEFDYQFSTSAGDTFVFPDFPFTDLPKLDQNIKETVSIRGGGASQLRIRGSADNIETN